MSGCGSMTTKPLEAMRKANQRVEDLQLVVERVDQEGLPWDLICGPGESKENAIERFLQARNWNTKATWAMLKTNVAWREGKGMPRFNYLPAESILDLAASKVPEVNQLFQQFPFGLDRDGAQVVYLVGKGLWPGKIFPHLTTFERLVDYYVWRKEQVLQRLPAGQTKMSVVVDIAGMTLSHVGADFMRFVAAISAVDQSYYPERMKAMYIVNAPRIFCIPWRVIKPVLDEATVSKIKIQGSSYSKVLFEAIDPSQVPREYGGTAGLLVETYGPVGGPAQGDPPQEGIRGLERSSGSAAKDASGTTEDGRRGAVGETETCSGEGPTGELAGRAGSLPPLRPRSLQGGHSGHLSTTSSDYADALGSLRGSPRGSVDEKSPCGSVDGEPSALAVRVEEVVVEDEEEAEGSDMASVREVEVEEACSPPSIWGMPLGWPEARRNSFTQALQRVLPGRWVEDVVHDVYGAGCGGSFACCLRGSDHAEAPEAAGEGLMVAAAEQSTRVTDQKLLRYKRLLGWVNIIYLVMSVMLVSIGGYALSSFWWQGQLVEYGMWQSCAAVFWGLMLLMTALGGIVGLILNSRTILLVYAVALGIMNFGLLMIGIGGLVFSSFANQLVDTSWEHIEPSLPSSVTKQDVKDFAEQYHIALGLLCTITAVIGLAPMILASLVRRRLTIALDIAAAIYMQAMGESELKEARAGGLQQLGTVLSTREHGQLMVLTKASHLVSFCFGIISLGFGGHVLTISMHTLEVFTDSRFLPFMLCVLGVALVLLSIFGLLITGAAVPKMPPLLRIYTKLTALISLLLFAFSLFSFSSINRTGDSIRREWEEVATKTQFQGMTMHEAMAMAQSKLVIIGVLELLQTVLLLCNIYISKLLVAYYTALARKQTEEPKEKEEEAEEDSALEAAGDQACKKELGWPLRNEVCQLAVEGADQCEVEVEVEGRAGRVLRVLRIRRGAGGGSVAPLSAYERLVVVWAVSTGLVHLFHEGAFVVFNNWIKMQQGRAREWFLEFWYEYGKADSRYLSGDAFVVTMQMFISLLNGPLCFVLAWAVYSQRTYRHIAAIGACIVQIYTGLLYFGTEVAVRGSHTAGADDFLYFWVLFLGLNLAEILIPIPILWRSCSHVVRCVALTDAIDNGAARRPKKEV